jgi:hypothetical protein
VAAPNAATARNAVRWKTRVVRDKNGDAKRCSPHKRIG